MENIKLAGIHPLCYRRWNGYPPSRPTLSGSRAVVPPYLGDTQYPLKEGILEMAVLRGIEPRSLGRQPSVIATIP